jgi:ABC-type glutathione transport system ATPase component
MSSSERNAVLRAADVLWEYKSNGDGKAFSIELDSLELCEGELLALLGASGSGKSTLSSLLCGVLPLQEKGAVEWRFEDSWQPAPLAGVTMDRRLRRHFGMVYQDYRGSLNDRRTVFDIVRDPLDIHCPNMSEWAAKRAVLGRLRQVGIPNSKWRQSPSKLSGGQRQRVALARALVLRPRFLFLDEPTSSLDPSMQARILRLLMDARAEWAPSCVLVTHDFALVRQVADRVVVLDKGRVVDLGTVDKVFSDPRPKTRELLESSKLDGRL